MEQPQLDCTMTGTSGDGGSQFISAPAGLAALYQLPPVPCATVALDPAAACGPASGAGAAGGAGAGSSAVLEAPAPAPPDAAA